MTYANEDTMTRRTMWIPDDLWERINHAALAQGMERGEQMSASEWVRQTCERRLDVDQPTRPQ